jgi:hypothetical protein
LRRPHVSSTSWPESGTESSTFQHHLGRGEQEAAAVADQNYQFQDAGIRNIVVAIGAANHQAELVGLTLR